MAPEKNDRRQNFENPADSVLLQIQGQVRDIYDGQIRIWELMNGKEGKFGIVAKVGIMWVAHGWIILGIGVALGALIEKWVK